MEEPNINLLPTKKSLLGRLRNWKDESSWKEFFDTYWKLIYKTAICSGLTDDEAQEVVQETVISVAKHIPEFNYDPKKGTFRGWMLTMTRWRIKDQFKKRQAQHRYAAGQEVDAELIARIADPNGNIPGHVWEELWEENLFEIALERAKQKVDPRHFQVFDLYALQNWPPKRISSALGISAPKIYLIKHRISKVVRRELEAVRSTIPELQSEP